MQCCQGIAKAKVVCNISMKGWEKPYQNPERNNRFLVHELQPLLH